MSDILSKLRAVHDSRAMVKVHVPEYGLDLYFPPLTLADHEKIRKGINPKDEHALMVAGLVHQARTETGEQAFPNTPQIKAELHRMEFGVLARIMAESAGGVSDAAQAELAAIDHEALKGAVQSVLADSPVLQGALENAPAALLVRALAEMAAAADAGQSLKNG
ncbi:hypothetical protein K3722_07500 [Leisingera caerulea]|uniref:Uncharacterized protein n=1 Tax=Leisingera caerulea TaxID=506591 RepID=A0ABY5X0R0_LEICA|nr:hypothetical protein [Leisingera caerulea]UWQ59966.1 hypothetical protein K3722_07500 [Leisingera caerulea]